MLYHVHKCETEITCLSDIAYDKHSKLFHICIIMMLIFLFPSIITVLSSNWIWLSVLSSLSLIGVSLTPYKDSKLKYRIHLLCALFSMFSVEALWIIHGYWFIPFIFCIASLRKQWLLGLEIGLLSSMFLYGHI